MGCCFDKKELIEIRFPKSSLFFLTEATHSDLLTCKNLTSRFDYKSNYGPQLPSRCDWL
jgi:hypothetical protein